jgi:phosphatidylinositol alpha-mannosyltransferase
MKIGLVSPYDYIHPGGVSEHVRHLADELRARGHDVRVLAPSSKVGDDHGIPGYIRIGRSVPFRGNGSVARIALSFHLVRRVRSILKEEDFDIVHYHEPLVPGLPITLLRFHRGANVGTFHATARRNLGYYYARPFLRRYFKRLHACIAVSPPARDFVARYFFGDYRIVPNGVDTKRFRPDQPKLEELHTPGKVTILFVGRLEKRKGVGVLLDAYADLRKHRDDCRLVIVGDGPLGEEYHTKVLLEHIPDVLFAGRVSNEELPRYYASADVFCSPAISGESFGIVLLEAMASGLPVLASAIPGFTHVIKSGSTGLLVPPKQPRMWAQALEAVLNDAELRKKMGEDAVVRAQRFDWQRVVSLILDVYREARERANVHMVAAGVHQQATRVG